MNSFEWATQFPQMPVGYVIQSPCSISDPRWVRCDGSVVQRAQYPALSAVSSQVGVFTSIVRPLFNAPNNSSIAVNGNTLVMPGYGSGSACMQYSTNAGVSWNPATGPASIPYGQVVATANGFYVAAATSGSGAYSTNAGVSWTASSGGTAFYCVAAYGNTVLGVSQAGSLYISTNGGQTFSGVTTASGSSAQCQVVWTGTQFILFNAATGQFGFQTSLTGASGTWTSQPNNPWGGNTVNAACSDGNGNVLALISSSYVAWVSNNGGTTWRQILLPASVMGGCSYANGRWFVPSSMDSNMSDGVMMVSADLNTWVLAPQFYPPLFSGGAPGGQVVFSGGNYVVTGYVNSAVVNTVTENSALMYLPRTQRVASYYQANYQEWIKAA